MQKDWYYSTSGQTLGPLTLETLASALRSQPEWRRTAIWRDGFADWRHAEEVSEVAQIISASPPRPPPPPLQSYRSAVSPTATINSPWAKVDRVALYLSITLGSAVGFSIAAFLMDSRNAFVNLFSANGIGVIIGSTIGCLFLAGIVPLILYCIPSSRRTNIPAVAWSILTPIVGILSLVGVYFKSEESLGQVANSIKMSAQVKAEILDSFKRGCINKQIKSASNTQFGVTQDQIEMYCSCTAKRSVASLTPDEWTSIMRGISPALQRRLDGLAFACLEEMRKG